MTIHQSILLIYQFEFLSMLITLLQKRARAQTYGVNVRIVTDVYRTTRSVMDLMIVETIPMNSLINVDSAILLVKYHVV